MRTLQKLKTGAVTLLCCCAFLISSSQANATTTFSSGCCDNGNEWWNVTTYNSAGKVTSSTTCDCNGVITTQRYISMPGGGTDTTNTNNGTVLNANTGIFTPGPSNSWNVNGSEGSTHVYTVSNDTNGVISINGGSIIKGRNYPAAKIGALDQDQLGSITGLAVNPSFGGITATITLDGTSAINIQMYDILGRLVFATSHQTLFAGDNQVILTNLSEVHQGTYFLRVESGTSARTQKFTLR